MSITQSLCPFEQGGCQSKQEEKNGIYDPPANSQCLTGDGESDAEDPDAALVQPEHPNSLPRSATNAFAVITLAPLHYTFLYDQFHNLA